MLFSTQYSIAYYSRCFIMFIKLSVPFSLILAGPSGCGKSTFAFNLLRNLNNITGTVFQTILWCYSETGSITNLPEIPNIRTYQGIPDVVGRSDLSPTLIIIDDLMTSKEYESRICDLFIKESHHRNISIIFICQNIFYQSRFSRTISLNAKYLVVFRNIRDKSQFLPLARQLHPEKPLDLLNIYKQCTSKPYSYLFIDLSQETPEALRYRCDIFDQVSSVCFCSVEELQNLIDYERSEQKVSNRQEEESENKRYKEIRGEQVYFICT